MISGIVRLTLRERWYRADWTTHHDRCLPSSSYCSIRTYGGVSTFFFFFQAEDGIRDHCVTGVQTCALPIYRAMCGGRSGARTAHLRASASSLFFHCVSNRSEERRVGKEGRSRWSPYH